MGSRLGGIVILVHLRVYGFESGRYVEIESEEKYNTISNAMHVPACLTLTWHLDSCCFPAM